MPNYEVIVDAVATRYVEADNEEDAVNRVLDELDVGQLNVHAIEVYQEGD